MKEPKYLKNICPVCNEPQLGVHYHESDEERIEMDAEEREYHLEGMQEANRTGRV